MTHATLPVIQAKLLEEKDLPMLHHLLSDAFIAERLHWSPSFSELDECYQRYWCSDPDERNYLLIMDNRTVGWLKLNGFSQKNALWISMLAVAPEVQGQDIGTWALEFSEYAAKESGHPQLCVQTTVDNVNAVAFYIHRGFRLDFYDEHHGKYTFLKPIP